ncbi:MAG: DNA polymerase III subunit gamma and tau [Flaviflexus sp.]|nr:DNA polymerase III subunit gamma and tau [Flaviflexus sp.]
MGTALYRRYRPETFEQVIGQDHVTVPLMAALESHRTNHAYLFSGPRGCGKTTSARILARCLNCAEGPVATPCGQCESCIELARDGGGSLDVVEMDAASHGSVDDARDLCERATFAPVRDRYKIFIIDEAHMVSPQGFNALLKLVEEPPAHVKFVFATTEPDKVIGTIRSRTHHYPFRLVPPETLETFLADLCEEEGVEVGPGVLPLVVRAGTGSVRDTLSVLDQLIGGATDNKLDYETVVSLLGYTDAALLDETIDALANTDGAALFQAVNRVVQSGQDPRRFVEDLLARLRDLVVMCLAGTSAKDVLVALPEDQYERMSEQAELLGAGRASRSADITNAALAKMVGATSPRLQLELLCARLLTTAGGDIAERASRPAGEDPREAALRLAREKSQQAAQEQEQQAKHAQPAVRPPAPSRPPVPATPPPEPAIRRSTGPAEPANQGQPAAEQAVPQGVSGTRSEATAAQPPVEKPAQQAEAQASREPAPEPQASSTPSAGAEDISARWSDIRQALHQRGGPSRITASLIEHATVVGLEGNALFLAFPNEGMAQRFFSRQNPANLAAAISQVCAVSVEPRIAGSKAAGREPSDDAEADSRPRRPVAPRADQTARAAERRQSPAQASRKTEEVSDSTVSSAPPSRTPAAKQASPTSGEVASSPSEATSAAPASSASSAESVPSSPAVSSVPAAPSPADEPASDRPAEAFAASPSPGEEPGSARTARASARPERSGDHELPPVPEYAWEDDEEAGEYQSADSSPARPTSSGGDGAGGAQGGAARPAPSVEKAKAGEEFPAMPPVPPTTPPSGLDFSLVDLPSPPPTDLPSVPAAAAPPRPNFAELGAKRGVPAPSPEPEDVVPEEEEVSADDPLATDADAFGVAAVLEAFGGTILSEEDDDDDGEEQ